MTLDLRVHLMVSIWTTIFLLFSNPNLPAECVPQYASGALCMADGDCEASMLCLSGSCVCQGEGDCGYYEICQRECQGMAKSEKTY